jgi:hypothetical protein
MTINHDAWANIWGRALKNMPYRSAFNTHYVRDCQNPNYPTTGCQCDDSCIVGFYRTPMAADYGALARCLGYPLYSGKNYSAHNRVYSNYRRGSVPRDPKVKARLLKLAGANGALIAWLHLKRIGLGKRYARPF